MAAIYPDLEGQGVLVTGGASGIGAEIVRHFVAQKAKVAFLDIAEEAGRRLVEELSGPAHFARADLTDILATQAAIAACAEAVGPIRVLVNNAAHDQRHANAEVTPAYWDERMAVNLKHQFFCAQAVMEGMKAAGGGAIVNMGSTSWMMGQGGMPAYTTAKSAIQGLTRSLARDLGPDNIRVLCVAPGWIMTERQLSLWVTPEAEARMLEGQCLKRRLVPADIARAVTFFASEEAGAMTNQTYIVDGGWL